MDAITHTVLALGSLAGAYYGGRWLLVREARSAFPDITADAIRDHIIKMDRLIKQMASEDDQWVEDQGPSAPLQLELFGEYGRYGYSPSE